MSSGGKGRAGSEQPPTAPHLLLFRVLIFFFFLSVLFRAFAAWRARSEPRGSRYPSEERPRQPGLPRYRGQVCL